MFVNAVDDCGAFTMQRTCFLGKVVCMEKGEKKTSPESLLSTAVPLRMNAACLRDACAGFGKGE